MAEFFALFSQSVVVALEAAWLTVAVYDNLRHPKVNAREFRRVLRMEPVQREDPEVYAEVSSRRIDNPWLEKRLFRLVVGIELVVATLLWLAALALLLAAVDVADAGFASAAAHVAVLGFIAIWAAFLIGGQWFFYWVGMQTAQATHFFLVVLGVATLAYLSAAP